MPEDWISAVIVPLYKGKGERNEYKNFRGISFISVVGKIYAGILIDRVRKVTEFWLMMSKGALERGGGV